MATKRFTLGSGGGATQVQRPTVLRITRRKKRNQEQENRTVMKQRVTRKEMSEKHTLGWMIQSMSLRSAL